MGVKSVNIISGQSLDKYDVIDQNLLPSKTFIRNFGDTDDYIEAHLYTKDDRLLLSNYNVRDYKIPSTATSNTTLANAVEFDPAKYIQDIGYQVGDFKLEYRILRKKLFTIASPTFFISEISKDRTEIRLTSNTVSDATLEENTLNFLYEIQSSQYFKDFLLNFGDNKLVNAVNIALDKNTSPYSVVVKLYGALPTEFDLKSTLWVVEELADPITFEVELVPDPVVEQVQFLGPANFNVEIDTHKSVGSTYQSLSSIYNTDDIQSYQDVVNKLNTKSAAINVDYTDYQNFVHFSSAQQRLNNFYYKLQTIEGYNNDISILEAVPNYSGSVSVSSSIYTLQHNVNNLVKDMDGYEKFLYSATSSAAWPKYSGSLLYTTDSTEGLTWFGDYNEDSPYYGGQSYTASLYDLENQDNLTNVVPEYLAIDEANSDYLLFVNMLGQQFDEVWLYIKGMNDLYKAENSVSEGISKDMVFTALRSLGIKVYNSNSNQDIFEYLLGNASGSYTVTGSSEITSGEDISKELFKRIYHNLPYLLKSKGSEGGLKGIISTYGIPDTILSVIEYGGSDKFSDTLEYVTDRFSYGYICSGSNYVELPWAPLTQNNIKYGQNLYPDSIELRFTPDKDNIKSDVTLLQAYSESIVKFGVSMHYTSSEGVPSANVMFTLQNASSSLTLPVYATGSDGQPYWWNMLLKRNIKWTTSPNSSSYQVYQLDVQNGISGKVGHTASLNLVAPGAGFEPLNYAWGSDGTLRVGSYALTGSNFISGSEFLGKLQELRLWSEPLSGSYFNLHTLNNESIAESASYDNLAARFPLGNSVNLTISESIHPNVSIDYMYGNNLISFTGSIDYESFYEYQYNSTNLGPVTDKVRIVNNDVEGEVLSPFLKLEKPEQYRTKDSNFTDISFSPQSEIDKDILAQYGYTLNLDEFLGDPRVQYDRNYSRLELLKQSYYKKYISTLNYKDFIKLVDSFDNSLFKMLSDNAPVTSNVSTGITVKSPILERNRVKRYQPEVTQNDYTASIAGQTISAGMPHAELTTGFEFYTGKLSGSIIDLDDHFAENNFNEYVLFKENLDTNKFEHSSFNVLHGNVSRQRLSNKFKKIDPYNDEILEQAQIQDSYYTSKAYLLPRYEGSKSTSRYYNVYTQGDAAYGKNAAIYRNVLKFGYVNQGSSNSLNFCDKTSFNLKYLIDPSGSVLELSKQNNNLFEVQNTFKSGESVIVSVTDPLNPTNQAVLGGPKIIYEGGYSYSPVLYREINETLTFDYLNPTRTIKTRLGVKVVSTSSIDWVKSDPVRYTFNTGDTGNSIVQFYVDSSRQAPGTKMSQADFGSNSSWPYTSQIPFSFSGSVVDGNGTIQYVHRGADNPNWYALDWFLPESTGSAQGGYKTSDFDTTLTFTDNTARKYTTFTAPRQSTYSVNVNVPIIYNSDNPRVGVSSFKVVGVIEKNSGGSWTYVDKTTLQLVSIPVRSNAYILVNSQESYVLYDIAGGGSFGADMKVNCVLNNRMVSLDAGDQIRLRVYFLEMEDVFYRSENIKFGFDLGTATQGYLEIYDAISSGTTTMDTVTIGTSPQIFTLDTGSFNTLIFNSTASLIYNNSIFSSTGSSVADKYSPITDVFQFNQGDLVRFDSYNTVGASLYSINSVTYPVILNSGSVQTVVTPLQVTLDRQVNTSIVGSATTFAFIRRNEDETNVTVNFKKPAGDVSPVILIPNNLRDDVKNNIANIIQPLKGNLLI